MKTHRFSPLAGGLLLTVICHCPAHGQFNTLELWGNAVGTTPEASYTIQAGTISITAGGQDYWSASDQGAFLWNDTGTHTTTGDFTASVRHLSTTTPAPEWGRSGIMARATQSEGELSANDAYWMPHRKSNGQFVINRRPSAGSATYRATDAGIDPNANDFTYNSDTNDRPLATGDITIVPWFLSIGREGDFWYGGYAMDLGGGVPGRWINHWSTDVAEAVEALQGEAEVIVGLAHQSHPQTISPDENDINTATFDNWAYQGEFDIGKFGEASGTTTWQVAGTLEGEAATGHVLGSAYVSEGEAATGEAVGWTLSVYPLSSFTPSYGLAGSRRNPTAMSEAQLVPAENFRQGGEGSAPGLKADIYIGAANAGSLAANLALITNSPAANKASTVISRVFWSANNYPQGEEGNNLFADAHADAGAFLGDQSDYGVEVTGEIFIPGDAARVQPNLPGEFIVFKDGNDDFCYLEIDGRALINDNDWTDVTSSGNSNGGGNVAVLDVSDPKFNDGEWVSFRMIMWEGGGGDNMALYWSALDEEGVFTQEIVPGTFGNLVPAPGVENSRKDATAMLPEDLVPAADFRHQNDEGATEPGLRAEIFLSGNDGNFPALDAKVQNQTGYAGEVVLPNVYWSHPGGGVGYPSNGAGGDVFEDAGATLEEDANNGYGNYGVNLTGEIFIPGKAERTVLPVTGGDNLVLFKDGVDDFCYLEIDGQVLINDGAWTNVGSTANGGGNVALLDVSAPKYDDGEWVSFRLLTWEGGGGDDVALYWSARDTNGTFGISTIPGSTAPAQQITGTNQVGSESTHGRFGDLTLPAGDWLLVLDVANTGTALRRLSTVSVTAVGPAAGLDITSFAYDAATTTLNLTFTSEAGASYALEYTTGFQPAGEPAAPTRWTVVPSHAGIAGAAGTTSIAPLNVGTLVAPGGPLPDGSQCYFRVRKL